MTTVFSQRSPTLAGVLDARAEEFPDKVVYRFLGGGTATLSYRQLQEAAQARAAILDNELRPGDRALLVYPPGLDFIVNLFGCMYAGIVAVPTFPPDAARPDRAARRIGSIVSDCAPAAVLTESYLRPLLAETFAGQVESNRLRWIETDGPLPDERPRGARPAGAPDSAAMIQYTSGSTSDPRGVVLTHANLLHNEEMIRRAFGHSADTIVVSWLPFYHDMGLIGTVMQPLYVGGTCVLMSPLVFMRDPRVWLEAIDEYRATTSGGPNFAYELCVKRIAPERRAGLDLSSWEIAFNGSEPVHPGTMASFAEAFAPAGFRSSSLFPCYGLAEATLIVSAGPAGKGALTRRFDPDALARDRVEVTQGGNGKPLVAAGAVLDGAEIAIADATGSVAAPGQVGEIWVRGGAVATGYWNRGPDEVWRATLAGGDGVPYLRTGDLGFVHDGQLFVTGRRKDVIIIRGRNVYPQDIERAAVESHPALSIGATAAFATPDPMSESVAVLQELRAGATAAAEELIDAVRRAVAETCQVTLADVVLVKSGSLPKTTSGKIRRSASRDLFLRGELKIIASGKLESNEEDQANGNVAPAQALAALQGLAGVRRSLEGWLLEQIGGIVRRPPGRVDPEATIVSSGVDSLGATELAGRIEAEFGAVPPFDMLLDASPRTIVDWLVGALARSELPRKVPAPPKPDGAPFPLSHMQKAIWFERQLAPTAPPASIGLDAEVLTDIDGANLDRAARTLVQRHDALRAHFEFRGSELVQTIAADSAPSLALLRVALSSPNGPRRTLSLVVEHIVADFASCQILFFELFELLQADREKRPPRLAPPRARYADFVRWEEALLAGPTGADLVEYWRRELAGLGDPLPMPSDRPRPPVPSHQRGVVDMPVDAGLADAVRDGAARHGVTTYTYLLSAVHALVHAYTGQRDVVVGSPASTRPDARFDAVVGCFINPIVLRARIAPRLTFAALLVQQKTAVAKALEHRHCPFDRIVRELGLRQDPSHNPLFQVTFTHYGARTQTEQATLALAFDANAGQVELGGIALGHADLPRFWHRSDLAFAAADFGRGNGLRLRLEFNADLFDRSTAARMLANFVELLRGTVGDAEFLVGRLPFSGIVERHLATVELNDAPSAHEQESPNPLSISLDDPEGLDRVAIVSAQGYITYGRLEAMVDVVARRVRARGLGPDDPVGICARREPWLVAAILGILRAGAAYVPLDPEYPPARIERCVRDCRAELVFTDDERTVALLPSFEGETIALGAIELEEPTSPGGAYLVARGASLAYVMHTSGSTNEPKGVMVTRGSVASLLDAVRERSRFERDDVMLAVTTVSFDISVVELLMPLSAGARIVVADRDDVKDARRLSRLIQEHGVTVMQATPAGWGLLCASGWTNQEKVRVLCGGDALSSDLAARLAADSAFVVNLYGPTETTIWSTAQRIRSDEGVVSIGRPIGQNRVYLLNDLLSPVPIGGLGELYIGGPSVARGYLGAPGLTAARFVPDPFSRRGERLYRTGDFTRLLPTGVIEFRGRRDGFVKVRGHRVDVGEIEVALRRHPSVLDAAVEVAAHDASAQLIAYVELSTVCAAAALRHHLLDLLPSYMVPSRFRRLAAMPRTPNGKLDRGALARSSWQDLAASGDGLEPHAADPVLDAIVEVFREVLGATAVAIDDNFFELGAHSLAMAEAHRRLVHRLEADFELNLMFRYPTPRLLATRLAQGAEAGDTAIEQVREAAEQQIVSAREHRRRMAARRRDEVGNG